MKIKLLLVAALAAVGLMPAPAEAASSYHVYTHAGCADQPGSRTATEVDWYVINDREQNATVTYAVSNSSDAAYGHSVHVGEIEGFTVSGGGGAQLAELNYKRHSTVAGLRVHLRWRDGKTAAFTAHRKLPKGCVR
jgi:hypothetical protein